MKFFILFIVCFGSISTTPFKTFEDQTAPPAENSDFLARFQNTLETGNKAAESIQKCIDYRISETISLKKFWNWITGSKIEYENNIISECMQENLRFYNRNKGRYMQMNTNLEQVRDILEKNKWSGAKNRFLEGFTIQNGTSGFTTHKLCSFTQGYSPSVSFPIAEIENFYIDSRNPHQLVHYNSIHLDSIPLQSKPTIQSYNSKSTTLYDKVNIKVNITKLTVDDKFVEALNSAVTSTEDSINNCRRLVQVLNEYGWMVPIEYTVGDVIYSKKFEKGFRSEPIVRVQNNWHPIRFDSFVPSLMLLHNHNNSLLTICLRLLRDHYYVEEVRNLQPIINIEAYQDTIELQVNL